MVEKPNSRNLEQAGEFMQKIVREMQAFIRIVFVSLLKFYELNFKPHELKKDLLMNLVTTIVMKD